MVKPSDFKAIHGFIRSHYTRVNPVTTHRSNPSSGGVASHLHTRLTSFHSLSPKPTGLSQLLSQKLQPLGLPRVKNASFAFAFRFVSTKSSGFRKVDGSFARKVVDKPVKAVSSSFARYREAMGLHVDAFWKKNSLVLYGAGGVFVCIFLWRIMFGIASTFVGLSEGMAKYGFLALSSAIVAFSVSLCCFTDWLHNVWDSLVFKLWLLVDSDWFSFTRTYRLYNVLLNAMKKMNWGFSSVQIVVIGWYWLV